VDELTRFAQRLVEQLGASREGVHRPVEVAALRETVLPYRTHRRALGIDSVEDYETILLRLISGERGYVKTLPAQAAERCRKELANSNPDLGVLDEVGAATVQITSMAAAQIVDGRDDGTTGRREDAQADETDKPKAPVKAERPPKKQPQSTPQSESPVSSERSASSASSASPAVAVTCPSCHKTAPTGRQVVFCPWCGERLIPFTCSRCNTELDSEWKHCITCGAPVKDPYSFS
jgi:predicted RNA-binding Zn-ribbon protein involved in translation (DUF1610 family)